MKLLGSLHEVKTITLRSADGKLITITVDAQSADRIANIPALAADDSFVMANATQTLTNKTFPLGASNSFLGINDTVAGYLAVSESVQGFMDGVRSMTGYGQAKGDAWVALTAAEISYLSGTSSGIQSQFTTNTQEHVTINERISALEGGQGGGTVTTTTLVNTVDPAFADSTSVAWCFALNTAAGDVTFTLRAAPTANTTYQVRQDGTGTLTIAGNGVLIDGQNTKPLSTGEWCWLRLISGAYETIDENAVCSTDEIFESTTEVSDSAADLGTSAWVWVKFAPLAPITYDLRVDPLEGLTYHLSNKSTTSAVTVQPTGGALIDGQASLVLAAGDWAVLHYTGAGYYIAARNGSEGGGGFASGTAEMTASTLSDTNEEALVFVEKTYAGEATFTLKAEPVADDMRQIKNTGAGTLHIAGNGNTIAGNAQLDLEPGDWAWLRFRPAGEDYIALLTAYSIAFGLYLEDPINNPHPGAPPVGDNWYIADRSPLPLTSLEATFTAGETLAAGAAVVLRPDTKVYKATSSEASATFIGDFTACARIHAKKRNKYSWLECFINSTEGLTIRIKSVGSTIKTIAQLDVFGFHTATATASGLVQLDDDTYLYWISDADPSTHFCKISIVGNAIYTAKFTVLTTFIGVDKVSTRTYYAVAADGTLYQVDDIGNVSQVEATTSTFAGLVTNCIVAFPGAALVVLEPTVDTQRILWYYNIGSGTTQRVVKVGSQSGRADCYVHRIDNSNDVLVASLLANELIEYRVYEFKSNSADGLESHGIVNSATGVERNRVSYMESHLLEHTDGTISTFEYSIGVFTSSYDNLLDVTRCVMDVYNYSTGSHYLDTSFPAWQPKVSDELPISGFLGTPAAIVTAQYAQDGMCAVYLLAQSGTYQYLFDLPDAAAFDMLPAQLVSLAYPFIGFTKTAAAINTSVPVKMGPIITGLSGLAAGVVYNLGADGTVTTKFLDPEMKIGLATASTTMITKVYEG